ncbi:MAG: sugar-transfer associated ATP-grasp domain-containing protein [Planctomycetota bacterium]|jgi:hypothetical protein
MPKPRHLALALKARQTTGKGLWALLGEILALRLGEGRLGFEEYFDFKLHDDAKYTAEAKHEFAGWRALPFFGRLNDRIWHATANDKLTFGALMLGQGFLVPDIYAVYHPGRRRYRDAPTFHTHEELAAYLRDGMPYPFFSKPVQGTHGRGTKLVARYDRDTDELVLGDRTRERVERFAAQLESPGHLGHLFQEVLRPSPAVREVCGDRISSVRMVVLLTKNGPELFRVEWKLAVGDNMVDSIGDGSNGNLVAAIDCERGVVRHALPANTLPGDGSVPAHPDTGARLLGRPVPEWEALKAFVLEAARVFPGLRLQAWDVASTDKGIVGLEVNLPGVTTIYGAQQTSGRGFLTPALKDVARRLA